MSSDCLQFLLPTHSSATNPKVKITTVVPSPRANYSSHRCLLTLWPDQVDHHIGTVSPRYTQISSHAHVSKSLAIEGPDMLVKLPPEVLDLVVGKVRPSYKLSPTAVVKLTLWQMRKVDLIALSETSKYTPKACWRHLWRSITIGPRSEDDLHKLPVVL